MKAQHACKHTDRTMTVPFADQVFCAMNATQLPFVL